MDLGEGLEWVIEDSTQSPRLKIDVNARLVKDDLNGKAIKDSTFIELGKQLLLQAKMGHAVQVEELMALGAPFTADWVGTSPLHWAADNNHVDVTSLLLRAGISRNARNKVDRTPLHVAAQKGHHVIVSLLLQFGSDVNCRDMLQMTPLHWAAQSGCTKSIQLLLDYGASPDLVSKFDKTPAMIAFENGHIEAGNTLELASSCEKLKPLEFQPSVNIATKLERTTLKQVASPQIKTPRKRKKEDCSGPKEKPVISLELNGKMDVEPEESTVKSTFQLLKEHGIVLEPDCDTVLTSAIASGQSVKLTEAGKLALSSINQKETSDGQGFLSSPTKVLTLPKKVITIKPDQLINMTKGKKIIIKSNSGKTFSLQGTIQRKIYTKDQADSMIETLQTKLSETMRQVDLFRTQLQRKEKEAEALQKQLDFLMKCRQERTNSSQE